MATIEERAEAIYKGNTIEEDAYKRGATEQKAIDEDAIHAIVEEQVLKAIEKQKAIDNKMFDQFLCSLRSGNMWEGREWRFQRMWREFMENYIAMEE